MGRMINFNIYFDIFLQNIFGNKATYYGNYCNFKQQQIIKLSKY